MNSTNAIKKLTQAGLTVVQVGKDQGPVQHFVATKSFTAYGTDVSIELKFTSFTGKVEVRGLKTSWTSDGVTKSSSHSGSYFDSFSEALEEIGMLVDSEYWAPIAAK